MRLTVVAFLVAACVPHPPPTPTPSPTASDAGICTGPALVSQAGVCDGFFTRSGAPCVRCDLEGCYAVEIAAYCTRGPCAADPTCSLEPEDGPMQRKHR